MKSRILAVVALSVMFGVSAATATTIETLVTLSDQNSSVEFDLSSSGVGMNQWTVDGMNRLREQSFWYRVGDAAQQRVNLLELSSSTVSTDYKHLEVSYHLGSQFTIDLQFDLTGFNSGSGLSDIREVVKITNTSAQALDFHLYEYVDVNLLGPNNPEDSYLELTGEIRKVFSPNTALQTNGTINLAETVVSSSMRPSRYEAGYYSDLVDELGGASAYDLNISSTTASNGDLAWAFQWDKTLAANGGQFAISKDKFLSVVPEPSSCVLLGMAALGVLAYAWRRRRRAAM